MAKTAVLPATDHGATASAVPGLMRDIGLKARQAAIALALAPTGVKRSALRAMAQLLIANQDDILAANRTDIATAKTSGMAASFVDRLALTPDRIAGIARSLEEIAALPDPVGATIAQWDRPNGLHIERVRVPLGVVGIIYESRPNVTADAGALCMKSGNAAILRGGSEDRKSTRLNSSHLARSRMPSSA